MTAGPDLMSQAARLFFDRQLSKVEIASTLGISRFRVARLIDQALERGLVRIEYRDTPARDRDLARTIEERYGLDLCVVATGDVAGLAASIVDGLVGPDDIVGIAWGSTLAATVAAMPLRQDPSIEVVQLAGSSARLRRGEDPVDLARLLAERWGARHHPLFAPAFVERPDLRAVLLGQPELADTVAMFGRLTVAVVGIGAIGPATPDGSSLVRSGAIAPAIVDELVAGGVVGDVVLHPVTEDGRFPASELASRAIGISVDDLRRVRRVVAVAGGAPKAAAIRGALRAGIVRMLVTDTAAAAGVVEGGA
jgi:DNA-binding transcriptional regulator LsrR (DeoR family)